jgi:hypothetical protein
MPILHRTGLVAQDPQDELILLIHKEKDIQATRMVYK